MREQRLKRGRHECARCQWTSLGKPNHVWLHFELPGENQPCIRALGELKYERKLSNGQRIRGYRFKYMAPRERVAYNRFLAELDVKAAA